MGKRNFVDIHGERFGDWLVIGEEPTIQNKSTCWECVCLLCGREKYVDAANMKKGKTTSCGRKTFAKASRPRGEYKTSKAGGSVDKTERFTSEYYTWKSMLARCYNIKHKNYSLYGGKGVSICDKWKNSYIAFLSDMGRKPGEGYSIDRYPNKNGNYEIGNVRWATSKEQNRNKCTNYLITYKDKTQCVTDWAIEVGLAHATILYRLKNNWSIEDTLETPGRNKAVDM